MTVKQIELVESSWDYIIMNTEEAGMLFYNRLFEIDPSLRHLFKENIQIQSQKLVSMITFVVQRRKRAWKETQKIQRSAISISDSGRSIVMDS
jgi:hypothetical protein